MCIAVFSKDCFLLIKYPDGVVEGSFIGVGGLGLGLDRDVVEPLLELETGLGVWKALGSLLTFLFLVLFSVPDSLLYYRH